MKTLLVIPILLGMSLTTCSQDTFEPLKVIPLYEGVAPGSETWDWEETNFTSRSGLPIARNVVKPVLMYYPPAEGTDVGTAMIIAPGGGFRSLMMSYEGIDVARFLNRFGVHAFVLKYRLIHQGDSTKQTQRNVRKLAAADGQQAVRVVRKRAAEVDSSQIGSE